MTSVPAQPSKAVPLLRRLSDLTRQEVQDFVDRLHTQGLSASTIQNTLNPLQAIYRRSIRRGEVNVNPTRELDLRAPRSQRKERIASAKEAVTLLNALPPDERALWATALYGGLRRGELRALKWSDVDLGKSEIRVAHAWDAVEGPIDPKSETSERTIPLLAVLRDHLDQHKLTTGRDGEDLVFGATRRFRSSRPRFETERSRSGSRQGWSRSDSTSADIRSPRS